MTTDGLHPSPGNTDPDFGSEIRSGKEYARELVETLRTSGHVEIPSPLERGETSASFVEGEFLRIEVPVHDIAISVRRFQGWNNGFAVSHFKLLEQAAENGAGDLLNDGDNWSLVFPYDGDRIPGVRLNLFNNHETGSIELSLTPNAPDNTRGVNDTEEIVDIARAAVGFFVDDTELDLYIG